MGSPQMTVEQAKSLAKAGYTVYNPQPAYAPGTIIGAGSYVIPPPEEGSARPGTQKESLVPIQKESGNVYLVPGVALPPEVKTETVSQISFNEPMAAQYPAGHRTEVERQAEIQASAYRIPYGAPSTQRESLAPPPIPRPLPKKESLQEVAPSYNIQGQPKPFKAETYFYDIWAEQIIESAEKAVKERPETIRYTPASVFGQGTMPDTTSTLLVPPTKQEELFAKVSASGQSQREFIESAVVSAGVVGVAATSPILTGGLIAYSSYELGKSFSKVGVTNTLKEFTTPSGAGSIVGGLAGGLIMSKVGVKVGPQKIVPEGLSSKIPSIETIKIVSGEQKVLSSEVTGEYFGGLIKTTTEKVVDTRKTEYVGVGITQGRKAVGIIGYGEGKIRVGTPELSQEALLRSAPSIGNKEPILDVGVDKYGFIPSTPLETAIVRKSIAKDLSVGDKKYAEDILELSTSTKGVESRYKARELPFDEPLRRHELKPETRENIKKYLESKEDVVVYGSLAQKAQMVGSMKRTVGDVDLKVASSQVTAKELLGVIEKTEPKGKVRLSEKNPSLIETDKGHLFDVHSLEVASEQAGSKLSGSDYLYYGFKAEDTIKIGGIKAMTLSEQGVRKAGSILEVRTEKVGGKTKYIFAPPQRRFEKDITDYPQIQETLIRSQDRGLFDFFNVKLTQQKKLLDSLIPRFKEKISYLKGGSEKAKSTEEDILTIYYKSPKETPFTSSSPIVKIDSKQEVSSKNNIGSPSSKSFTRITSGSPSGSKLSKGSPSSFKPSSSQFSSPSKSPVSSSMGIASSFKSPSPSPVKPSFGISGSPSNPPSPKPPSPSIGFFKSPSSLPPSKFPSPSQLRVGPKPMFRKPVKRPLSPKFDIITGFFEQQKTLFRPTRLAAPRGKRVSKAYGRAVMGYTPRFSFPTAGQLKTGFKRRLK